MLVIEGFSPTLFYFLIYPITMDDKITTANVPAAQNATPATTEDKEEKTPSTVDLNDPEALKKKVQELEESIKKHKSDSERGVQKILKEKKEAEEYVSLFRKSVKMVRDDKASLLEIYEDNPKVAKEILEEYFDGMSMDEFIQEELEWKVPTRKVNLEKEREKIRKQVEEEYEMKQAEKLVDKYSKDFEDADKEKIKEEFMDIVWKRKLTTELVKKYFKVAVSVVKPVKKDDPATEEMKKPTPAPSGTTSWKTITEAQMSVKKFLEQKKKFNR
jgi:hypothetical protein